MTAPTSGPAVPGPADAPARTVVVLTEDTLTSADVEHITALHREVDVDYRVLVPADTERNLLVSVVDHLGLGELREALDVVLGREPEPAEAKAEAVDQLAGSLQALAAAGATADGEVVADDPVPALAAAVARGGVREIVVVTYPHAVEDTFHRDWASRARDELQVPVLHLYAGTSEVG
ncbi:hypothetical protein [Cellulomonas sp. ATA003]|uniref:hypothetical protein n=1 Tax=Cellulomonas sp. ATA003 TaxID=3073064 RepID=UPI002873B79C|nr:hypothetical protein [Cellulomonas sp. ATA003]WNB84412.1 hypothetical protein REH70_11125 [Cellulomonas sp. ATA003]